MTFIKVLILQLTKPFWCSANGIWQWVQLKQYERQQKK